MNQPLKELVKQMGWEEMETDLHRKTKYGCMTTHDIEKFAKLIVWECLAIIKQQTIERGNTMTDPDYREAIRITGKNETELLKWAQDMRSDFIINRSEDEVQIVYTDGDDGLIIFTGVCEIFDDCGIKIETVSAYCDIADEDLIMVLNLIREPFGEYYHAK